MLSIAPDQDAQSLSLATGDAEVDELNAEFYGAIRYPGPPMCFERLQDTRFWADALDHDLGRTGRPVLPAAGARVWVAGCGTNQAVITALMFPDAQVVGSDLSAASLEMAAGSARQLGVSNLELRRESIHEAGYVEEFDYVICTGVIHHTSNPAHALAHLAAALRPGGAMQLMVYNRYHRTLSTAFQKAMRALLGDAGYAYDRELELARRFVHHFSPPEAETNTATMGAWLAGYRSASDPQLADTLIQPVEHSFTVESLDALARGAGLEMLTPFPNQFDAAKGTLHWELDMGDPELQRAYDELPDARRWQVTNLMALESSPMLWFYLQRQDSPVERRSTRELCEAFLAGRYVRSSTVRRMHLGGPGGVYSATPSQEVPFPVWRGRGDAKRVYDAANPAQTMGDTLRGLGIDTSNPRTVNRLRVQLASSAYPYLRPAPAGPR